MEDIDVDVLGSEAFVNKLRRLKPASLITLHGSTMDGEDYYYPHPLKVVKVEPGQVKVRTYDHKQYFIQLPQGTSTWSPRFTWRGLINGGIDPLCEVEQVRVHETDINQNDIRVATLEGTYARKAVADGE